MKRLFWIMWVILFVLFSWITAKVGCTFESLDEIEARKARKSANTFYSGEDASYLWQPQITIYKDTSTYHEVWIWSKTANKATMGNRWSGSEYNWQPWSADGKRIAFYQDQNVGCYVETGHPWFVSRSDGSYMRPTCESASRSGVYKLYPQWSPIVADIMYSIGSNYDGNSGKDLNGVYRETVSDSSFSSTIVADMIGGNTSTVRSGGLKSNITGDGLYMVESAYGENQPYYIIQLEPDGSRTVKGNWNLPTLDTYWYATINPASGHLHDEGVAGNASEGYWFYAMPSGAQGEWWRIALWGSDGGVPSHTTDHTSPYDWWTGTAAQTEVQIPGSEYGWAYGNHPAFTTDAWWSHGSFDRWGTYVVYSDVENPVIGPAAMRISSYTRTAIDTKSGGTQYHCWLGWSDYFVSSVGNPANIMGATKYNSSNNSDHVTVAELHSATTGDFSNPGQSPDGTKMVLRSDWLNPSTEVADLFVGVVYYPYPPEITSCVASGGTVTTGFNWRTDQPDPRTYTTRGWPDEDNDDPPPPRETSLFRLWRSTDKAVWMAVGTVNAEIFTRYDFSDGTWNGGYGASTVWEITDTPGNGTFYYAVTAQEWSGLESRALSNIYKVVVAGGNGTGALDVLYPSSPGDLDNITASDFYVSPPPQPLNAAYAHKTSPATANGQYRITWDKPTEPSTLDPIHHFNIYAEDGAAPDVAQTNLVASYVLTACGAASCTYIDWLGKTDGTTQYKVTSVDQQGNESAAGGGVTTTSTIATTSSTSIPTTTTSSIPLTTSTSSTTSSIITTTSSSSTSTTTSIMPGYAVSGDIWVSSIAGSSNYSGSSRYPYCSRGGIADSNYVFMDNANGFYADMEGEFIKIEGVVGVIRVDEYIDQTHIKLGAAVEGGYNLYFCIGGSLPTLASLGNVTTTTVESTSTTSSSIITTTTTTIAGCTGNTVFDAHFENDDDVTVGTPAGCSVDVTQTISKSGATFSSTNKIDGTYSLYLNGYQHRATIDCSDFDLTTQGSVSFWIKEHATAGIQGGKVFVLNPTGSGEIFVRLYTDGKFYLGVTDADGTYSEFSTAAISADGTAQVQAGWDLATDHLIRLRLCTDGTCDTETWQTTTNSSLGDTGANPNTITIGAADDINHYGWIDNFTIYSSEDCT